ncbi:unnamed protein product [Meganyctiphanes norvegica]|uniref:Apextrin C-terminal domain-containing protein n=1 Tax=Meganyctiphanes norvegica TaxID=48144 RepID=A0AAV2QD75_MEGNR
MVALNKEFCIKTNTEGEPWPKGDYCIYMYQKSCPTDFGEGSIYFDDEDHKNKNGYGGTLPSGGYDKNTSYRYCCKNDGDPDIEILLPTTHDFFLFPHSSGCQRVYGMTSSMEYLHFDTQDHKDDSNVSGMHPKVDIGSGSAKNPTVYYCFYTPTQ